jgi:hypothetical protein
LACRTWYSGASWSIVCFWGALSSDQRLRLIHLPLGVWERSCGVPVFAADLVHGALGETYDVEGVNADLGVGQVV